MIEAKLKYQPPEYSVGEISNYIKRTLEDTFADIKVRGEISGFKIHSSGHVYFNLKDENAVLNAVCWKGNFNKTTFKPEDGMEVIITGNISSFPGRSNYQINVKNFEIAGVGELLKKLEERKKKFAAEGLFAQDRKKTLPLLPDSIGVITSPTGAVIRDILHRIKERFPLTVKIWPVAVQGFESAEQVANAIKGFNKLENKPDVLIVARGGGSIEDLWGFNEEIVVRAIAESEIPIISAIGHETDFTLSDYVADKRAPTPTAAAEMCVPVRNDLIRAVRNLSARSVSNFRSLIERKQNRLDILSQKLKGFEYKIDIALNKVKMAEIRLNRALKIFINLKEQSLKTRANLLHPKQLLNLYRVKSDSFAQTYKSIERLSVRKLHDSQTRLNNISKLLNSYNYKSVLKRGFALVWDENNAPIKTKSAAKQHSKFALQFADGKLNINLKTAKPQSVKKLQIDMFADID